MHACTSQYLTTMAKTSTVPAKKLYADLLKLMMLPPRERKEYIRRADTQTIKSLCDTCWNALYNKKFKVDDETGERLRKSRATIAKLADSKIPLQSKRAILVQKGGFLSALLPAIIGTLGSLFLK